jgi:arylsulfatase A-like enzyme
MDAGNPSGLRNAWTKSGFPMSKIHTHLYLNRTVVALALVLGVADIGVAGTGATAAPHPNIVVVLADDLGYGDVGCYGATQVRTSSIDRLAREGMRFTAAHSPASICTASRYNLMTGRYCWRGVAPENRRAEWDQWHRDPAMKGDAWIGHVAIESNEPLLINEGRMTLASLLKSAGYATACVGKWHLGFGRAGMAGWDDALGPDWNRDLVPGPREVGFDYYFGLPIVNSSEPKVFVENHRVVGLDPADPIRLVPSPLITGRLQFKMTGGQTARFRPEQIDERFTEKAIAWMEHAAARPQPFFLYLALSSPHRPFAPAPRFKGTSAMGVRGDVIHELDGRVGEVRAALERLGIAGNTLLIFASDNGGERGENPGLAVNGPLRGLKTEVYEGGHRVPFIVRWPGRVPAGSESAQLVALTDLMATFAEIAERSLPHDAGEDSFSLVSCLVGAKDVSGARPYLVTDSMLGMLAIQEGPWKLIVGQGGGGYYPRNLEAYAPDPTAPAGQLYNLADGLGETKNRYTERPDLVARLTATLEKTRKDGRSRP